MVMVCWLVMGPIMGQRSMVCHVVLVLLVSVQHGSNVVYIWAWTVAVENLFLFVNKPGKKWDPEEHLPWGTYFQFFFCFWGTFKFFLFVFEELSILFFLFFEELSIFCCCIHNDVMSNFPLLLRILEEHLRKTNPGTHEH